VLNRIVRWCDATPDSKEAIEMEADPRHASLILQHLGLDKQKTKGLTSTGEKHKQTEVGPLLPESEQTSYRSCCMRVAFLASDRWELKFASKECARHMSSPSLLGMKQLKHIGRFLKLHPRVVQRLERQPPQKRLVTFSDSDHAGCTLTRKSTSCSCTFYGSHCIQFAATTQIPISLSSGESEYNSLVRGASVGIGMKSLAADFKTPLSLVLKADSTAAKGIASRRGAGNVKHIDIGTLWLQQHVTNRMLTVEKEDGKTNPADMGTKYLKYADLKKCMLKCGLHFRSGQSKLALKVGQ